MKKEDKNINISYYVDSVYPGTSANKVAKVGMVNGFAKLAFVKKVSFYFFKNKKINLNLSKKIKTKAVYCSMIKDEQISAFRRFFQHYFIFLIYIVHFLFKNKDKNEVIFIRGDIIGLAASIISYIRKTNFAFELHNYEFKNSFKDKLYKFLFKKSKLLITVTKNTKNNWIKAGIDKNKIIVLPSGVNYKLFSKELNVFKIKKELNLTNKKIVCYTGNFLKGKGEEEIFYAAHKLKNYVFICFGGTKEKVFKLNERKEKEKINNLLFKGHVKQEELIKYIKISNVLISPYSSNCPIINHISPLKIYEYMASGIPAVVADIDRIKEVIPEKAVYYYKTDNYDDFVNKIEKAYKDKNKSKKIKEAKKIAEQNSWKNRAKKILEKW